MNLTKPFFILAPMDDVTDTVFRQIVADCAKPDLFFTEFVNVDGLQSPGRPHLLPKLLLTDKEKPVIAQIWGLKPENYYKTTKELKNMGFAGVDINMGCPAKTVVKNGACSALINNKSLAGEIIDAVKEAASSGSAKNTHLDAVQGGQEERASRTNGAVSGRQTLADAAMHQEPAGVPSSAGLAAGKAVRDFGDFPVSVKTRVGFTSVDMSWPEFLLSKKLNMLSIHGRTRAEMSKVPANWDLIGEIVKMRDALCPSALIVGNGDVRNRQHGLELIEKYNLDGVMIGRGIFDDPFVFAERSPWSEWTKDQKLNLFKKHIELHVETYKNRERRFETLRKFCKVYINGFDGASDLRAAFMETQNPEQALALLGSQSL